MFSFVKKLLTTIAVALCLAAPASASWYTIVGTPTGPAGGDLAGTYPNPTVSSSVVKTGPITSVAFGASPYTVLATDRVIACDSTGGNVTLNLPASSGGGRQIILTKVDNSANYCSLVRAGGDTVDGQTSIFVGGASTQYMTTAIADLASGTWYQVSPPANWGSNRVSLCGGNQCVTAVDSTGIFMGALSLNGNLTTTTNNISSTTGTITSTTGKIGTTSGGIISATGGAAPTLTAGCNGSGSAVAAGSTNNKGQVTTQTAASTTCTITWSAAATWPQAPFCTFFGTPGLVPGACGTSTCVFSYTSISAATPINYVCM